MVAVIFRFLASGNSKVSMSFSYRITPSTVHFTTITTCKAIWEKLPTTQLPQPIEEGWKKKEEEFYLLRQFLSDLDLLMANTMKYKHNTRVGFSSLSTKRFFFSSLGVGLCQSQV
jgi:hypothetical protein